MSTELVTIGEHNPLSYLGVVEGEPLKPVRLALVQPINQSDEDGTIAGRWLDAQSNFQYEKLNVVILEIRNGRVMFESQELGSKPLCKSDNGTMPLVSDDLQRQDFGRGCAKCLMSQWKKIAGRNVKPACQETMTILVAQVETGFTYRINAKGVGLQPFKDVKETMRKTYLASKAKGHPLLPTQMQFTLSALKIKGAKGTYYVPKFSAPSPIEDEMQQEDINNIHDRLVVNRGVNYAEDEEDAGVPQSDVDPVAAALHGEYVAA